MKAYLADTHALIWFFVAKGKLGRAAARAFEGAGDTAQIHVSAVTLWEVAHLYEQGRLELGNGYSAWREALGRLPGIRLEPLFADDVEEARRLGAVGDPFDRLIAGTALRLGVPLLSKDERLRRDRRLRVVW